jgi:hypothetical protein
VRVAGCESLSACAGGEAEDPAQARFAARRLVLERRGRRAHRTQNRRLVRAVADHRLDHAAQAEILGLTLREPAVYRREQFVRIDM